MFKSKIVLLFAVLALLPAGVSAQSMLQQYLDASMSIVPNHLSLSIYEEIKYNDNIHRNIKRDAEDAVIFRTGASALFTRTKGNITYGLQGDISYDWYSRDSNDLNAYQWSITPTFEGNIGKELLQGLMLTLKSRSVFEPYSKRDTRYVRHFENGFGLAYDYTRRERWGIISTFDYTNSYYPQSSHNYSSSTNNKYTLSVDPYYRLTEKIRSGLHLAYEIVDYRNDKKYDDSSNVTVSAFADYRVNMFLNMTAMVGMERDAYEGRSRGSKNDRDFEPAFSYVLRYIPNADWTVSYVFRFEPEYGSDAGRGQRQAMNHSLTVSWNATAKINVTQTFTYDINDEKNCAEDTNDFHYNLRVNYSATDNIDIYCGYDFEDIHFKYNGDGDYSVNEVMVGFRWTW